MAEYTKSEIHLAAAVGDTAELAELLRNDPKLLNSKDEADWTPLMHAAWEGQAESVKVLISAGANIKAMEEWRGWMALHTAVRKGNDLSGGNLEAGDHLGCLKALLKAGANPNEFDRAKNTPLLLATLEGRLDCALTLIAAGANTRAKFENGDTPLHCVIHNGHLKGAQACLEALVSAGADLNARGSMFGKTPAQLAAARKFPFADYLIKATEREEKRLQEKQQADEKQRLQAAEQDLEKAKRDFEKAKRDREKVVRDRETENSRRAGIMAQREEMRVCKMCGKPLSLLSKLRGIKQHENCTTFAD